MHGENAAKLVVQEDAHIMQEVSTVIADTRACSNRGKSHGNRPSRRPAAHLFMNMPDKTLHFVTATTWKPVAPGAFASLPDQGLPRNEPAASCTIKNESTSSSFTASMKNKFGASGNWHSQRHHAITETNCSTETKPIGEGLPRWSQTRSSWSTNSKKLRPKFHKQPSESDQAAAASGLMFDVQREGQEAVGSARRATPQSPRICVRRD